MLTFDEYWEMTYPNEDSEACKAKAQHAWMFCYGQMKTNLQLQTYENTPCPDCGCINGPHYTTCTFC